MASEFGDQLIIIANHNWDQWQIPWTEARSDLYTAGNMPQVRFDGKYVIRGADSTIQAANRYRPVIEQRLAETDYLSQVEIHGQHWFEHETVFLSATFTLEGPDTLSNLRSHLIVLVNGLEYSGTLYNEVTQAVHEEDVTLASVGSSVTISAPFPMDPEWSESSIECIAFIQEMTDSLTIAQTVRLPLGMPFSDRLELVLDPNPSCRLSPNPLTHRGGRQEIRIDLIGASFSGELAAAEMSLVSLYDAAGHLVRQLVPRVQGPWQGSLVWDGRDRNGQAAPAGVYWLRPDRREDFSGGRLVLLR